MIPFPFLESTGLDMLFSFALCFPFLSGLDGRRCERRTVFIALAPSLVEQQVMKDDGAVSFDASFQVGHSC